MERKGFTLVELLGVMVILVVIFLLVFPSVNNIISKGKETVYQTQINKILNAAYDLSLQKNNYLPNKGEKSYITLGELKYEGLIDVNIENPETNKKFVDDLVVSIYNVGTNYEYSNSNSKLEGDYLYTVETNKRTNQNLLPKISLQIKSDTNVYEDLEPNSDGNYIITLDINGQFSEINYTATSKDEIDLTNKVVKYILKDNNVVENIDVTKSGIYKINYSVVDNNGYANTSILNVIIGDSISPKISSLENVTIGKDIKSFDLLDGVTCEDNSGYCDISTSGAIKFGVADKYIIEYAAQDPSGNVTTKKRIITVE